MIDRLICASCGRFRNGLGVAHPARVAKASAAVLLFAIACVAGACDESLSKIGGPTPNLEPTFTSIQRDIFDKVDSAGRPACTGCHVPGGRAASTRLFLTADVAYDNLVNVPARFRPGATLVIPGDPDNSYVIHKLEGRNITGARMPLGGPFLTEGQMLIIKRWIALGAPRN